MDFCCTPLLWIWLHQFISKNIFWIFLYTILEPCADRLNHVQPLIGPSRNEFIFWCLCDISRYMKMTFTIFIDNRLKLCYFSRKTDKVTPFFTLFLDHFIIFSEMLYDKHLNMKYAVITIISWHHYSIIFLNHLNLFPIYWLFPCQSSTNVTSTIQFLLNLVFSVPWRCLGGSLTLPFSSCF